MGCLGCFLEDGCWSKIRTSNGQRGALHCQCSITHTLPVAFRRGLWDSDSPESHNRSSKQSRNERDNSGFATQMTHVAMALAGIALAVVIPILSDMVLFPRFV